MLPSTNCSKTNIPKLHVFLPWLVFQFLHIPLSTNYLLSCWYDINKKLHVSRTMAVLLVYHANSKNGKANGSFEYATDRHQKSLEALAS